LVPDLICGNYTVTAAANNDAVDEPVNPVDQDSDDLDYHYMPAVSSTRPPAMQYPPVVPEHR
jgi:hypothetical protein